ncbi:uncharacterized protein [Henckelia pumila]|uniref:uncharacterized protein isoform X1 n=1 Tax=Henckelia pumila TaxID=405737 RepID=UPI003C6E3B65
MYETAGAAGRRGGAVGCGGSLFHPSSLQLHFSVPAVEVPSKSAEEQRDCLGESDSFGIAHTVELVDFLQAEVWSGGHCSYSELVVVDHRVGIVFLHRLRRLPAFLDWFLRRGLVGPAELSQIVSVFWCHALFGELVLQNTNYDDGESRECQNQWMLCLSGTLSTVFGKDYVRSTPKKGPSKLKRFHEESLNRKEAEQFLCSKHGEECELS